MSGKEFLPNVYSLGYRSGQTVQSVLSWGVGGDQHSFVNDTVGQVPSLGEIWSGITNFPFAYRAWWLNLLATDPVHVFVETTLLCCVVYMLFGRNKDYWKSKKQQRGGGKTDKLTKAEEEELIEEWRNRIRQPLAGKTSAPTAAATTADASSSEDTSDDDDETNANVQKSTGGESSVSHHVVPAYVPIIHKMDGRILEVSIEFEDERLQKQNQENQPKLKVLNFANFDFLGMGGGSYKTAALTAAAAGAKEDGSEHSNSTTAAANTTSGAKTDAAAEDTAALTNGNGDSVIDAARGALDHYGCGSCGPRGFYGTIDVHLELEEQFAKFIGTDGAILYSDGASTCSSTVAAFAKRGDLIIVDEGIYEPLVSGIKLSRAYVKWFKHNDMADLRRVLEQNLEMDKKLGRKPNAQRRFIVCEGLYRNTGRVAPLDQIVALKHEFNCRLILDESHSFGTLGPTGKGALELYGKRNMYDAEIVTIALENAIGSIGGITVGSEEVVDHQRLSGSGYCFSASSPPFTASAAIQSLKLFQEQPRIRTQLYDNIQYMYKKLEQFCDSEEGLFSITSEMNKSCIAYLVLSDCPETESIINNKKEIDYLQAIVYECLQRGVAFVVSSFGNKTSQAEEAAANAEGAANNNASADDSNTNNNNNTNEKSDATDKKSKPDLGESGLLIPPPAIRITVTAAQRKEDIDTAIEVLKESVDCVTKRFVDGDNK